MEVSIVRCSTMLQYGPLYQLSMARSSIGSIMSSRSSQYDGPSPPHRFVRLNPRFDRDETLELLKVRVCVCVREISCKILCLQLVSITHTLMFL